MIPRWSSSALQIRTVAHEDTILASVFLFAEERMRSHSLGVPGVAYFPYSRRTGFMLHQESIVSLHWVGRCLTCYQCIRGLVPQHMASTAVNLVSQRATKTASAPSGKKTTHRA